MNKDNQVYFTFALPDASRQAVEQWHMRAAGQWRMQSRQGAARHSILQQASSIRASRLV